MDNGSSRAPLRCLAWAHTQRLLNALVRFSGEKAHSCDRTLRSHDPKKVQHSFSHPDFPIQASPTWPITRDQLLTLSTSTAPPCPSRIPHLPGIKLTVARRPRLLALCPHPPPRTSKYHQLHLQIPLGLPTSPRCLLPHPLSSPPSPAQRKQHPVPRSPCAAFANV